MTKTEALLRLRDLVSEKIGAHMQIEQGAQEMRDILGEFEGHIPAIATESAQAQVATNREHWEAYRVKILAQLGLGDIPE